MHLLAGRGAKLGLDGNHPEGPCFGSTLVPLPATQAYDTENRGVFRIDSRYHDRFNLRHVFFILCF